MPNKLRQQIPGNIPDGVIRNQHLDLSNLSQQIVANELFECSLSGEASEFYGELGPNLISCTLDAVIFPLGVSHFDAKDTIFLDCHIEHKFDRILATKCVLRGVLFNASTLRDTVFVDSFFEDVIFDHCDFSVTTFKTNVFKNCSFRRCSTSNKLFEHCLFYHCTLEDLRLQESSILQNYGLTLHDTSGLLLYRAETGAPLLPSDLAPQNRLERISFDYFQGNNLNQSQDLLDIVQFRLEDATRINILHTVTGIRQLASFLLFLYAEGRIILFFPLQLFWSIDQLLNSCSPSELPITVSESLELTSIRLRRIYEEAFLSIPRSEILRVLIAEEYSQEDLQNTLNELGLNGEITSFRIYNSPSLAEIVSPDTIEFLLLATVVLSTRFHAEVDHYHAERKFLDIGARLISEGKTNANASYQALVVLNVPKLIYIRLSARINLTVLGRLRKMIVGLLDERSTPSAKADKPEASRVTKILFLAANPPTTARLRLDHEARAIDDALRSAGVKDHFRLEQAWAVDDRYLQDSLLRFEPDIVHLSAHGKLTGEPLLENSRDVGSTRVAPQGEGEGEEAIYGLSQIFASVGRYVRCVVLNSCHSAKAAAALSPYVDCVIGMSAAISDEAAIRFSWSFYHSLAYGKSIKSSFDLAVAQVAFAGNQQSQVPELIKGRTDPRTITLFDDQG